VAELREKVRRRDNMTPKVTKASLEGACPDQVALFARTFPRGAAVSAVNIRKAANAGLGVSWWAERVLTPAQAAAYLEATATASKAYREATAPAWKAYWEAKATASKAYREATATASKAYREATAEALISVLGLGGEA
jgi:hypothetical protein